MLVAAGKLATFFCRRCRRANIRRSYFTSPGGIGACVSWSKTTQAFHICPGLAGNPAMALRVSTINGAHCTSSV
jgi:hypothetical protein